MTSAPAALRYPIEQHRLDNGLRVIASPDHVAPSVAVNLWYGVGSRHEEPGRTGFAHLFEHVMFQGSAQVPSGQHMALMQAAGASVNATTWFDRTNYFETLPTGGLDLALWLEADRLGSLLDALTQENLDNQREVVKEEKRQRYDNVPYGDVMERLIALTFPTDHPYGHTTIGSMADLDAATLADVGAFFRRHYLPNNAVLTIAGDIEPEDAFTRAQTYFGTLPAGPLPPARGMIRCRHWAPPMICRACRRPGSSLRKPSISAGACRREVPPSSMRWICSSGSSVTVRHPGYTSGSSARRSWRRARLQAAWA